MPYFSLRREFFNALLVWFSYCFSELAFIYKDWEILKGELAWTKEISSPNFIIRHCFRSGKSLCGPQCQRTLFSITEEYMDWLRFLNVNIYCGYEWNPEKRISLLQYQSPNTAYFVSKRCKAVYMYVHSPVNDCANIEFDHSVQFHWLLT